jgi:hypothetical protein
LLDLNSDFEVDDFGVAGAVTELSLDFGVTGAVTRFCKP